MLTRQNFERATGDEFLRELVERGCYGINYASYLPRGRDPHNDWRPTKEQILTLPIVKARIYEKYPLFLTIGRVGTEVVSRCFAGNQYFHVLPDGRVEPCPFASWSNSQINAKDMSITEITASDFFKIVREANSYGITGFTPCRADLYPAMRKAFEICGAEPSINEGR